MNYEEFEGKAGVDNKEPRNEAGDEENYGEFEVGEGVDYEESGGCEEPEDREILYMQNEFELNNEQGRPTRATRRPPCFRDDEFETRFRPKERRRSYSNLGSGDQKHVCVDTFCNFHKPR